MNSDYLDPMNSVGMPDLADSTLALDFLLTAKTGVRNCVSALAETASLEARVILRSQLREALSLHDEISQLMIKNNWLHPYNLSNQVEIDLKASKTTVQIAGMKLFPEDTSRRGMFASPDQ
jgi:similar to spore coat protein